jgi:ATP-dependent Clp protease ATP-binding subunit ClpA
MLGVRRRSRAEAVEPAPLVRELFAAARVEAVALRHDCIDAEHVLLAILARDDETARTLRGLGLESAGVREDIRRIVGTGPAQEAAFDARALDAVGVDLGAVRERVEAIFGEGALERASRQRGGCGSAGFGIAPRLKQALETARQAAAQRGAALDAGDIARGLAVQRDSVATRILEAHGISPERLDAALDASS